MTERRYRDPRPARGRVAAVALLALGCVLGASLAGCSGYRNDSLFAGNARRVYVPIFENDTFFRQIEFDLTNSVTTELRSRPGVHVVSEEEADIILEGRITSLEQRVLAINRRNRANEQSATTTVSCRVIDASTREVLKTFNQNQRIDFAVASGESLDTAQREAFYELARKIVFELESDW